MYKRAYNTFVDYEWDFGKADSNWRKHRVDFTDAISVFADDLAITIPDNHPDEERFITIGMNALGQILVVVYTLRESRIRIISARNPTRQERKEYEG